VALALLAGWSLLRPAAPGLRGALSPAGLALELVFGITLLMGVGFPLARLGAPVTPGAIAGLAALLAAALLVFGRWRPPLRLDTGIPGDPWSRVAGLLTIAALGLFLVKLGFRAPWNGPE